MRPLKTFKCIVPLRVEGERHFSDFGRPALHQLIAATHQEFWRVAAAQSLEL